ncbi:hypothetical protein ROV80_05395 [Stenotrophomonas pavanii]|uniref:hypothetical protein n=1 Tax=Stenotrophomonas pavanii TaxID=487698 RepID=UPI002895B7FF|nr:hypothetical protein [Stenotrophomonas pavanii]MDT3454678.1 hypothetical protein [Stenotrophomonas pavanii]
MSMLDGVSQCWPIAHDCHIWWEAWSAIGAVAAVLTGITAICVAWVGIGVTSASAYAVWRLGIAANRASQEATRIAGVQAERTSYKDDTEQLLVLVQVAPELVNARIKVERILAGLNHDSLGGMAFATDKEYRDEFLAAADKLSLPILGEITGRLHYVDRPTAARMLRIKGVVETIQADCRNLNGQESEDELLHFHRTVFVTLRLAAADLAAVCGECEKAMARLQLVNH